MICTKFRHRLQRLLALTAGFVAMSRAGAAEPQPFTATTFAELRAAYEGRAFVVAFWSIACEPCREELKTLVALHGKFPRIPIVLVAADPPRERATVERFLRAYALGGIAVRQFADDDVDRLRYSVDRAWQGELPRSYFFTARHEVTPQTGVPDAAWSEAWFARASAALSPPGRAGARGADGAGSKGR